MDKARSYLLAHLKAQENPYAVAVTAYALSLNNHENPDAMQAHRKLMDLATCDKSYDFTKTSHPGFAFISNRYQHQSSWS